MSSENFYRDLPAKPLHSGLLNSAHYHALPADWTLVIVDIIGSTRAVAEGRYKDVNILSSCAIVAVLNRIGRGGFGYIYGGDGATFAIPSSQRFAAASALYGVQDMARKDYALDLRVGMVSVGDLAAKGAQAKIAKIETRPGIFQAALSGNGVALAEAMIKDAAQAKSYWIEHLFDAGEMRLTPPDYSGFECRWKPVHSRNGVDICLLVSARGSNEADGIAVYEDVLRTIHDICGDEERWKPVSAEQLSVPVSPTNLADEVKVRTHGKGRLAKLKYWAHTAVMTWTGAACFAFGWKAGNFDGKTYKEETAHNTDHLKFENALKLVMDIPVADKDRLVDYLERMHRTGKIFYGIHAAPSAMMTCLVFDYDGDHFHFIDGADGGYTMAAQGLKAQINIAREQAAA